MSYRRRSEREDAQTRIQRRQDELNEARNKKFRPGGVSPFTVISLIFVFFMILILGNSLI